MGGGGWKHREETALHPDSVTEQRPPLPLTIENAVHRAGHRHGEQLAVTHGRPRKYSIIWRVKMMTGDIFPLRTRPEPEVY